MADDATDELRNVDLVAENSGTFPFGQHRAQRPTTRRAKNGKVRRSLKEAIHTSVSATRIGRASDPHFLLLSQLRAALKASIDPSKQDMQPTMWGVASRIHKMT